MINYNILIVSMSVVHGRNRMANPQSRSGATHKKHGLLYRFKKAFGRLRSHTALFLGVLFSLGAGLITLYSVLIPHFALLYSDAVGHSLRTALASVFSFLPFAVSEVLVVLFALTLLVWLVVLILALHRKYHAKERPRRKVRRFLWTPICAIWIAALLFFYLFFPSYMRPALSATLKLQTEQITDQELYATLNYFVTRINTDADEVRFTESGASKMDFSFSELAEHINDDYLRVNEILPQIMGTGAPAKSLLSSQLLLPFHLGGVYTFFTGEACVNTAYPDFVLPYTAAHESAHQRGIAKENDASLAGFIACANSDDPYIRYSGYLNLLTEMLPEINDAIRELQTTDPELAGELAEGVQSILDRLDPRVRGELKAYSEFFEPYRDSTLAKLANEVNDDYLKAQGQPAGVSSYRYLTGFAVGYYLTYLE